MPSGTRRTHGGSRLAASPGAEDAVEGRARDAASRRISDLIRPASADAADSDTVHAHLLTAVHHALEPAHASVWIRQRLTTAGRSIR